MIKDGTEVEYTNEIFMCPLHRINYRTLWTLDEVQRDLQPLPATSLEAIHLPSDGTGGLTFELHHRLDYVAYASQRLAASAGVL